MSRHRKRTEAQQIEELNSFHVQAVHLVQWMATAAPGSLRDRRLHQKAQALTGKIAERFRLDRCYYCGNEAKADLGVEQDTGLCQCIHCASATYGRSLEQTRKLKDRLNDGYML